MINRRNVHVNMKNLLGAIFLPPDQHQHSQFDLQACYYRKRKVREPKIQIVS